MATMTTSTIVIQVPIQNLQIENQMNVFWLLISKISWTLTEKTYNLFQLPSKICRQSFRIRGLAPCFPGSSTVDHWRIHSQCHKQSQIPTIPWRPCYCPWHCPKDRQMLWLARGRQNTKISTMQCIVNWAHHGNRKSTTVPCVANHFSNHQTGCRCAIVQTLVAIDALPPPDWFLSKGNSFPVDAFDPLVMESPPVVQYEFWNRNFLIEIYGMQSEKWNLRWIPFARR